MDPITEVRLEELTMRLDTPIHRILASAVGGLGTVSGVGLAGLAELLRNDGLKLRHPETAWFGLTVMGVGTTGGAIGHFLIVRVAGGPLNQRAFTVGGPVGLATALAAWSITYFGRNLLSPLQPNREAERVLRKSLTVAAVAGPAAGILVSLAVMQVLKRYLKS